MNVMTGDVTWRRTLKVISGVPDTQWALSNTKQQSKQPTPSPPPPSPPWVFANKNN